jgi:hypothetical protein
LATLLSGTCWKSSRRETDAEAWWPDRKQLDGPAARMAVQACWRCPAREPFGYGDPGRLSSPQKVRRTFVTSYHASTPVDHESAGRATGRVFRCRSEGLPGKKYKFCHGATR